MANNWKNDDLYHLDQIAHHDLWWAKGQLWTTANWAIMLLVALVGVCGLLHDLNTKTVSLSETWPFLVLSGTVALTAVAYLARLHSDAIESRRIRSSVKDICSELKDLYEHLQIGSSTPQPHCKWDLFFVITLIFAVSVGLGVSWDMYRVDCRWAVVALLLNFLAGVILLMYFAGKNCANRANTADTKGGRAD